MRELSIRSVDMQHTLQQTAAAERVQAVDRGQAEQQGQQFAQQFERLENLRRAAVRESDRAEQDRIRERERERREGGRGARRAAPAKAADDDRRESSDGEIHLIDVRA